MNDDQEEACGPGDRRIDDFLNEYRAFVWGLISPNRPLDRDKFSEEDQIKCHMIDGLVSEAGELAEPKKKFLYYPDDSGKYRRQWDELNMLEECGDVAFYLMGLCTASGFTLRQVIEANMRKLASRYPEGFNPHKAFNRDKEAENKALLSHGRPAVADKG